MRGEWLILIIVNGILLSKVAALSIAVVSIRILIFGGYQISLLA